MTTQMKDQVVSFLVATLAAAGDVGSAEATLLSTARLQVSTAITVPELAATLRELADKNLVASYQPLLGPARWRITAVGRSIAQEQGLA